MVDYEFLEIIDNVLDIEKYEDFDVDLVRWSKILIFSHLIYDEELDGYITDESSVENAIKFAINLIWEDDVEKLDSLMDEFNLYEEAIEFLMLNSYSEEYLESEFRDIIDYYIDNI